MNVKTKIIVKPKYREAGTKTGGYANTGNNIIINGTTGNYLPATKTDNGNYEVKIPIVKFLGNIEATGSITAHVIGNTPETTIMDQVITDNTTIIKDTNGALHVIGGGSGGGGGTGDLDEAKMWGALSRATNEQINISHINDLTNHINDKIIHISNADRIKWNESYADKHKHSNKVVLDKINATLFTHWNTAYANAHTHDNKSILDLITETDITNWNNKLDKRDAVGRKTTTSGEVFNSAADAGDMAHAEGNGTYANGMAAHAEGVDTIADGSSSHTEGDRSHAKGNYSHAEGIYTVTNNEAEHAEGKFNSSTANVTLSSCGIGADTEHRRNAFEITKDGKVYINGIGGYEGWNVTAQNVKSVDDAIKNVDSAKKLTTPHTIWGQTFDGTQNITGSLSNVVNIDATGYLHCNNVLATGEITAYSDERLKHNIRDLEDRGRLRPVKYVKDNKESIGFIAQDVQKIYPELVTENGDYLSLNYQQLTAVLAVQLNNALDRIEILENKLAKLI